LGDRARDKGEWERAARFYVDALARDSAVPELWLQLGHSLKAAGKSMEAEFAYRQAATLQSD
jgi:Flp pilus assembly protein TadD